MNLRLLTKCWKNNRLPLLLLKRVNQVQVRRTQVRKLSSEIYDESLQVFASKAILYPDSTDIVTNKIKKCSSLEELTNFLEKSSGEIATKEHICQLIVLLSEFACDSGLIVLPIVSRLNEFTPTMTSNELTSCYFYLNKLGIKVRHPTMEKISEEIVPRMEKGDDFDSQCLMKFTYVLSSDKCLYTSILSASVLPMLFKEIEDCKTSENLYAIATSINNISQVVSTDLLNLLKTKVVELLDKDLVTDPKCIFKLINFLNYPHWSFKNHQLIRRLLLELEFNFDSMDTRNLSTVNRAFQSQLESAKVVPMVVKRAQKLMEETPSVELLQLASLNVTPNHRMKTAGMARHFLSNYQIKSTDSGEVLQTLFKIVRLLKISDINMCDTYWTKALNEIYSTKESSITYRLSRHIHKYMFFNNNLGGTYRHQEFEKSMIDMLMKEMKMVVIPKDFAMFAAFIIAYGDGSDRLEIPDFIVGKIEQLHGQFTIKDCLMLSRGLQILQEMRAKNQVSLDLEEQIGEVNKVLGLCAKRHMKMENLHLTEINSVIRAYIIRKGEKKIVKEK